MGWDPILKRLYLFALTSKRAVSQGSYVDSVFELTLGVNGPQDKRRSLQSASRT